MKKEPKQDNVLFWMKYLIPSILLFIASVTFSLLIYSCSSNIFSFEEEITMLLIIIFSINVAHLAHIFLQD